MPIAVRDKQAGNGGGGWRVVTWIDSKATFGDDRTHAKQHEEQYSTCVVVVRIAMRKRLSVKALDC